MPLVSLHGETGLTVPPGNAAALTDAIETLLADDALREQYGKAARARVLQEFSLMRVMAQTRNVLLGEKEA